MIGSIYIGGSRIATIDVELQAGRYEGTIISFSTAHPASYIFVEYENVVLSQLFSIEERLSHEIDALNPTLIDPNQHSMRIVDLQLYPEQAGVSFLLAVDSSVTSP